MSERRTSGGRGRAGRGSGHGTEKKSIQISITFTPSQYNEAWEQADRMGISYAEFVRRSVDIHLQRLTA